MPDCTQGKPDYSMLNHAIKTIVRLHADKKIKLKDGDKGDRAALSAALGILSRNFPKGVE